MAVFSTFGKGGVHPADKKYFSKFQRITRLPVPDELVVAMSQHLGAPAALVKQKGDRVEKGELIGQASSFISANVHSPVSGVISDIRKVTLANSVVCDAAVIIPDKVQPEFTEKHDWTSETPQSFLAKIKDFGIVGMGGATFPANVKLTIGEGKHVDALVINAVECEPYITADYRLMIEKTSEVLEGICIIKKIINPDRVIIGFEANKMDAVEIFRNRISEMKLDFEVMPLKMKYPQGDEKQLLKATINREIPSGKLPLDVGAVVENVATSYAIYEAMVLNKPLFERVVTISGECVKYPKNIICPVGTKIEDIIRFAGGFSFEPDKYVSGGPMMGFAFFDKTTPITKGNNGLTFIKDEKSHEQTPCLSCGKCVAACPIGLEPTKMYALITHGKYAEAMANHLMDCKECGCCAFSCPAHLELVHAFKTGKKMGRKK